MVDYSIIVRARTPRNENQSDRGGALEGVIGCRLDNQATRSSEIIERRRPESKCHTLMHVLEHISV